ncbi:MAG: GcrA family cell cycle regulator [Pseudomonadota bacterium]|nr:GcrA family cell cycle regulator [Pseudomonadota bacterium]
MSKGWDSIALKKLKALTGKGLSTSEIGKRLGMSKNAIVGKLNRLGWNAKAGGAPTAKEAEVKATTKKTADKTGAKKAAVKTAPKAKEIVKKATVAKKETVKATEKKSVAKKSEKKVAEKVKETSQGEVKTSKADVKKLAMHQRIVQHSLEMANLKPNQCRWPIGDPDSEHFHFCGETVFVGKPYCYEHCKQAYQFTPPKKK